MEKIYKNNCHKISNYFSTLKFLYKSQKNDEKNLLERKMNNEIKILKMLFWLILKYFFIAHEISRIRKRILFMMFNESSSRFSEIEFEDILGDTSNLWLEQSYFKIKLLKDYCDKLFSDPHMCASICEKSNISRDEYYGQREEVLLIMEKVYNKYLKSYIRKQEEIIKRLQIPTRKPTTGQVEIIVENYKKNFNDDALLEKEEKNND